MMTVTMTVYLSVNLMLGHSSGSSSSPVKLSGALNPLLPPMSCHSCNDIEPTVNNGTTKSRTMNARVGST